MRKRICLLLALSTMMVGGMSCPASSEENRGIQEVRPDRGDEAPWGTYRALIIGISAYQEWPQLQTAVQDAEALKDVLVRRYDFPEDHIVLKRDKEATRADIMRALRSLASGLKQEDNLIIYFAGHGQLDDLTGDGFWVPVEGKLKAPDTWISHTEIKGILSSEKVQAKNIVVVADSCYSGTLLRGGPSLLSVNEEGYLAKLREMASRRSRQVITSGGLEPVADGGRDGHSLFAYYFLMGLEKNENEVIDLENLFHSYVWKPVTEIGGQRPHVGRLKTPMDEDGQFVLVREGVSKGAASFRGASAAEDAFVARDDGVVLDRITGLEWMAGPDRDITWDEARSWVEGLVTGGGGWRMPMLDELKTLFYKGKGERNMSPLLKTSGWWVWSGEAKDASSACMFGFLYGDSQCGIARHLSKDTRAFAARSRPSQDQSASSAEKSLTNSLGMEFVFIRPGAFVMGSPENETGSDPDMERQHKVTLTRGFYMQTTEVTQEQWLAVMGTKPWVSRSSSGPRGPIPGKLKANVMEDPQCAASWIAWHMCQEFIQKLNEKEGVNHYRLPTESEWEYACRAGSSTAFCFGDDHGRLGDYAWHVENAGRAKERYAHKVGTKKPNQWGLYDMHGNVQEWCEDWYGPYPAGDAVDPSGPTEGGDRVVRGGGWNGEGIYARSASRSGYNPNGWDFDLGFRVVRMP